MIALAAYTPYKWHDFGGHLICWWTRSPYSHVEVIINGVCYSSSLRDGGVRKKAIDLSKPHWRTIPIDWRTEDDALLTYRGYAGMGYGWGDLLTQHVLRLPVDDPGLLCSELCALMLGLSESMARGMTPGALVEYVLTRGAQVRAAAA